MKILCQSCEKSQSQRCGFAKSPRLFCGGDQKIKGRTARSDCCCDIVCEGNKEGRDCTVEKLLKLFKMRQCCDYDPMFDVDEETVKDLLKQAEEFVQTLLKM